MIVEEQKYILESGNKRRKATEVSCVKCGCLFLKRTSFIVEGKNNFCSRLCSSLFKRNRVKLLCAHCGAEFERTKSDLMNSKSGIYFCSRNCKDKGQSYIQEIYPAHYKNNSYRNKAFALLGEICSICGYKENLAALEVHHKDKNRTNNEVTNLQVLCCNCHRIHHYYEYRL